MVRHRLAVIACALMAAGGALHAARHAPPAPIFRFDTDNAWLNLHQFLYVLGRDASQQPDRLRRAVAQAPKEQADALAMMSAGEQAPWKSAVSAYASGPSALDAVFDKTLIEIETALAALKPDTTSLDGVAIPPNVKSALQGAEPIYRARFWPAHRAANAKWVAAMQPLLDQHGGKILAFITATYRAPVAH